MFVRKMKLSIFFKPQVEWFKYMTIVSAVTFTIFFNLGPGKKTLPY